MRSFKINIYNFLIDPFSRMTLKNRKNWNAAGMIEAVHSEVILIGLALAMSDLNHM